ncbi:MAG: nucleotidyltransferase domain-containing protein [bacterium]
MDKANELEENKFIRRLKECIVDLLKDEKVRIVLFGSRAKGNANPLADVDVGLIHKGKVDRNKIARLRESVEELNIPYKVDIVDFSYVSREFKKEALKEVEVWKDLN